MKHVAVKSLLSVMLSLMMLVVFIPTIAFADEPEATDEPQAVQPVDESDFTDEVVEADDVEEAEAPAPVDISEYGATITEKNDGKFGFDQLSRVKNASNAKYGTSVTLNIINDWYEHEYAAQSSDVYISSDDPVICNDYYYVTPLEITKGVVGIESAYLETIPDSTDARAKIGLFYDEACKKAVDGVMTVEPNTSTYYFKIPKTRTFYLAVGVSNWDSKTEMHVGFMANRYAQAKSGMTLKDGKMYAVRCGKGKTNTFKYKPKYTGYMWVETYEATKATLKTKSGKTLGSQASRNYTPFFGVKHTTYKLSVNAPKILKARGHVVCATSDIWKNHSGASKKKATNLNQGLAEQSRIFAGSKKSQWFKFKTTEEALLHVYVSGVTNNKIKFQFYKGKTLLKNWTSYVKYSNQGFDVYSTDLMPAGTYYIKVTPVKKSSGPYYLYWEYAQ